MATRALAASFWLGLTSILELTISIVPPWPILGAFTGNRSETKNYPFTDDFLSRHFCVGQRQELPCCPLWLLQLVIARRGPMAGLPSSGSILSSCSAIGRSTTDFESGAKLRDSERVFR